jgi:hypothetical protein
MDQLPEEKIANSVASGNPDSPIPGDSYDEDSGEFLGNLTDGEGNELRSIPAQISIAMNGYWYLFKIVGREVITPGDISNGSAQEKKEG